MENNDIGYLTYRLYLDYAVFYLYSRLLHAAAAKHFELCTFVDLQLAPWPSGMGTFYPPGRPVASSVPLGRRVSAIIWTLMVSLTWELSTLTRHFVLRVYIM